MAQLIGNIRPPIKSAGTPRNSNSVRGVGADNQAPVPIGLTHIAGRANEVIRLSTSQVLPSMGEIGVFMQSSVALSLRYSLSNPTVATDPTMYTSAVWTAVESLSPNVIIQPNSGNLFVVVEITFSADGIVSFYVR